MNACCNSWLELMNDFKRFQTAKREITENVKLAKETGGGKCLT
jgi:hypothetical protein